MFAQFEPQLVIVSQGYDVVLGDAEGCSNVTPAWFAHFIHALKPLAGGKLAVILEVSGPSWKFHCHLRA